MKKIKYRKPNGHISSYEIEKFYDWLLTPENERKEAVLNWTSGLVRFLGYIIERFYNQKNLEDFKKYPKYKDTFSTKPFMCSRCFEENRQPLRKPTIEKK